MHCVYELCYILIISIFNFLIFIHYTNQITLKPHLAQKLKLIFKFSAIMEQTNVPLWTHMGQVLVQDLDENVDENLKDKMRILHG